MKKMMQWYRNLKFRKKVWLCMLSVSLLPVIVLGIFAYFQCRNLLINQEQKMMTEILNQNVTALNGNLNLYKSYMDSLVWNSNLQQAVGQNYTENIQMYTVYRDIIDPAISNMENMDSAVKRVTIYSTNDTLYPHGENLLPADQMEIPLEELKDYKLHCYPIPDSNELNMYCKMYSKYTEYENIVFISLDYKKIFSGFTSIFADDFGITIKDEAGNLVFRFEQGEMDDVSDNYVTKTVLINPVNWKIECFRPIALIADSARSITFLVLMIILGCCGMVTILSMLLTRSVVRPLHELITNIDQIKIGSMSVNAVNESQDEIGHLFRSFKSMMDRLNDMIEEVYQSKILQQEYEMKALQAQINPHFLYNSLSLINWKAILAEQTEISEMAQLLSTFYRTTLNRGKNITTVKGEWDNTCSYVKIQQMLHSGKFETTLEIEEDMMQCEILNLLLQPVVENAIVHGLDHKITEGTKKLEIFGRKEHGELVFTVCDNGCGMSEEIKQNLLTMESKGYGVQNVHHRIQLYYGTQYGLKYESKKNEGTRVTITIPERKPEKN